MRELLGEFGYLSSCMPYDMAYRGLWHRSVWLTLVLDDEFPEDE